MGCRFLLQGIFLIQGSNLDLLCLLLCRHSFSLSHYFQFPLKATGVQNLFPPSYPKGSGLNQLPRLVPPSGEASFPFFLSPSTNSAICPFTSQATHNTHISAPLPIPLDTGQMRQNCILFFFIQTFIFKFLLNLLQYCFSCSGFLALRHVEF